MAPANTRSMRLYITLIVAALTMAFALGYFTFFVKGSYTPTSNDIESIAALKKEFRQEHNPVAIINFNAIYHSRSHFQLLNPIYTLNEERKGDQTQYSTNKDCFSNIANSLNRADHEKVWMWEKFRCGKRFDLPKGFFRGPPFIHPSGKSYTFLAYLSRRKNFRSRGWVLSHLPYFHVTELSKLKKDFGSLGGHWDILESLNNEALSQLSSGTDTILTRDYLFARIKYPDFYFTFEYRVFSRDELDLFLKDTPYVLHNFKQGRHCFYRDGQLCWDYAAKHLFSLINKGSLLVLGGMLLIVVIVTRLLIVKIRNQRFEDERRRLALQVLTHEFRTPISSMILMMERISKRMGDMDEELQEAFLHLSSDVYRLQRLTETSRNYLRIDKGKRLVRYSFEEVDSVNHFVEDQLFSYFDEHGKEKIRFYPLRQDCAFTLDPYWVGICLKNIINNAIDHGKFPVTVTLCHEEDKLLIEVQDAGECKFDNLDEMCEEFIKGTRSEGTGLGLNIVRKVLEDMGGELRFRSNPTRFTLAINNQKGEKSAQKENPEEHQS